MLEESLTYARNKCRLDNELHRAVCKVKNDQENELNRVNEGTLHHDFDHGDQAESIYAHKPGRGGELVLFEDFPGQRLVSTVCTPHT